MMSVEGVICGITSYASERGEIQYNIIHLAKGPYSNECLLQTETSSKKYIERYGIDVALENIKAFDSNLIDKIMKPIA